MSEMNASDKVKAAVMLPALLIELGRLRVASTTLKEIEESPILAAEGKEHIPALQKARELCDCAARSHYHSISQFMPTDQIMAAAITFMCESLQSCVPKQSDDVAIDATGG